MIVTYNNDFAEYRIEAPDGCRVESDDIGIDFVIVPDPEDPATPVWLWDELLIEAAQAEEFGLRLVSSHPLN